MGAASARRAGASRVTTSRRSSSRPRSTAAACRTASSRRSSSCSRPPATRRRGTRSASACSRSSSTRRSARASSPIPELAATAADELLRWAHPVHHFRRTATRTHEVHGQSIEAGDKVAIWYASGNFDESQFPEPQRFDLSPHAEPPSHLRARRPALLPRRAPREAGGQNLARRDAPLPRPARACRPG